MPPVQQWLQKKICAYVESEMGITVSIEHLSIIFPLDLKLQEVVASTPSDTLLLANDIVVDLGLRDLLLRRIRIDQIHLGGIHLDTDGLIEGIHLKGKLENLSIEAKRWDLKRRYLLVNDTQINDANIYISLADTTSKKDTTSSPPFFHKIQLIKGNLKRVNFTLQMPLDSMRLYTNVNELSLEQVTADLQCKRYKVADANLSVEHFLMVVANKKPQKDSTRMDIHEADIHLQRATVLLQSQEYRLNGIRLKADLCAYQTQPGKPAKGLDPAHLQFNAVNLNADSLRMSGKEYSGIIRNLAMKERCGLSIQRLVTRVQMNSEKQIQASLQLTTPYSSVNFKGKLASSLLDSVPKGNMSAQLLCRIGKPDLMMLTLLPREVHQAFPQGSILLNSEMNGTEKRFRLSRLNIILPGVFSARAEGEYIMKSEALNMALEAKGENLDFLKAFMGNPENTSLIIPKGITLNSKVIGNKKQFSTTTILQESTGVVNLNASYNIATNRYSGKLQIDSLNLLHFLPNDSITGLTASLEVDGQGTDIYSGRTWLNSNLKIEKITFRRGYLRGISANVTLKNKEAKVLLSCDNRLMDMNGELEAVLNRKQLVGKFSLNIWRADLKLLGLTGKDMENPFFLSLDVKAESHQTSLDLQTGDLDFSLESKNHFSKLLHESLSFVDLFTKQIENHTPNQQELRKKLPVARAYFYAGKDNLPHHLLMEQTGFSFDEIKMEFDVSPADGIRGGGYLYGLEGAGVELDTLKMEARQDSSDMKFYTTLINGPTNKFYTFTAQINTVIRNNNGDLMLKMIDSQGDVGADIGIRGSIEKDGFLFTLFPEEPIVAFRKMKLNQDNEIKLRDDGRVEANLYMDEPKSGMSISVISNDTTIAKQDLTIDLKKIDVGDVIRAFPFLPDIDGLFSGNFHIIEHDKLRFILNSELKEGKYNGMLLGDLGLRAGYMPDSLFNRHIIGAQLTRNGKRVVSVGGNYQGETGELTRGLITLHGFPLTLIDGFVPDQMLRMQGEAQGKLHVSGKLDQLKFSGQMKLDSAYAEVPMASMNLRFDQKDILIEDNQFKLNDYHIYAAGQEPFTITGIVDFRKLDRPIADLRLTADNYLLINNSRRTRSTELYGRLAVSLNTTVKGPLDGLKMRGNMRILGSTDLTYILKDSPLSVQDRLSDQVTFTNFADSLSTDSTAEIQAYNPSTMDLMLNLTIDPAVRVRAELSADGSNYVDLEGGGNLVLQGDPQSNLSLTGRYTLNSGVLKYAFSMIPLKEFNITSGSYVQWNGNLMNPQLHITAVEVIRSVVTGENNNSRQVNFNISVILSNTLDNLGVAFDISAPEDMTIQNQLAALSSEERSKQAITTLATGVYMSGTGGSGKGLTVSDALNSLLQSEINSLAGNVLSNTDFTIGMNRYSSSDGEDQNMNTDYSYKFAKRFWNNRIRVVIGGTISQGNNQNNQNAESFIDNVSIEYNFDNSGTKSIRIYHNKDYESLLEGEIVETGIGFVYRKKYNRWYQFFPWVRKKPLVPPTQNTTR